MKRVLIRIILGVAIIGIAVGGIAFYIISTPEYALSKTIEDVKSSGMSGLKKHLTKDAVEKIEKIESWTDQPGVSGILSALTQESAVSFLKSKISEVDWTVEEVLKGKKRADVLVGFNYHDSIVGTIEFTMGKEGGEWKIDDIEMPDFDKLSL